MWGVEELLLVGPLSSPVSRGTTGTEIKQESPVIWELRSAALLWPVYSDGLALLPRREPLSQLLEERARLTVGQ